MKPDEHQQPEDPPPDRSDAEPPPRLQVEVADLQSSLCVATPLLKKGVEHVLANAPWPEAVISVAVVDDAAIRELNRSHLQHDYATDVLSYPLSETPDCLEGEIVISSETALRNAADAGWDADSELLLYAVHGALHLTGYRDKLPADAAAMRRAEAAVFDQLGIARSASDTRWTEALPTQTEVGEPTTP